MEQEEIQELWAGAAAHHGVFTRRDALAAHISRHEIDRLLAEGAWLAPYPGVYLDAKTPRTWRGDLLAACWAGGPRAVASHRSALALYELPGGRMHIAELLTVRWRRGRHPGVIAHESRDLPDSDLGEVDAIPATTPIRTLIDAASVLHRSTVELTVDEALRRDLVALGDLWRRLDEMTRPGRRGVGTLRRILATRHPSSALAESVRESLLVKALASAGLPRPALQHEVRDADGGFVARVDAAYPARRIALEYDSSLHHGGRSRHVRDLARRNRLTSLGWRVIHVTGPDLKAGARTLCADLRAILAA